MRALFVGRLKRVERMLLRTREGEEPAVEVVHQLRVACRRAVTAIRLVHDALPRKRGSKLKKAVRATRTAAGQIRDLDVLRERLATGTLSLPQLEPPSAEGLPDVRQRLLAAIDEFRAPQAARLRDAAESLHARLVRRRRRVQDSRRWVRSAGELNSKDWPHRTLRREIERFERVSHAPTEDPDSLHALRIAVKQLRYAWELLCEAGAADDDDPTKLRSSLEAFQERLGRMNDHRTAERLLDELAVRVPTDLCPLCGALRDAELERSAQECRRFLCDWVGQNRDELLRKLHKVGEQMRGRTETGRGS
jgi:CHAD domain-containing protein